VGAPPPRFCAGAGGAWGRIAPLRSGD